MAWLARSLAQQEDTKMNRNLLYLGIGALAVVAVALGYQVYQDRQDAGGIEIQVDKSGLSIEQK
jgi:hypothetical protein